MGKDMGDCAARTVATRQSPSRVSPSRPFGRVSTIAITDGRGNSFVFPSWLIYPDDPDAPSMTSLWWQATLMCNRLHGASHKKIDLDPANFPHLRTEVGSGIFRHGAATALLFAGPEFETARTRAA